MATPTRPWVSVRCCVWQVATLLFALVVEAVEAVVCSGALVGLWAGDDVGVWALVDEDEVCAGDELDDVELDVEEHPVRNDVVIAIIAASIGIEFFICPYPS